LSAVEANTVRRRTILVAEDSEMDRFFLSRAFAATQLPHLLEFVCDGQETIDYLSGKDRYGDRQQFPKPDLLLLDLKMPRIDGFDVLKWIQASGIAAPPVLVLSGSDLDEDKQQALALGARAYYAKRANVREVVSFLKNISDQWLAES